MLSIPRPQRVSVRTNAFEITRLPTVVVVQYQIAFEPILKGAAIERRQRYMEHLQMRCAPELFPDRMMYDGGAVGFTTLPVAGLIGPQRVFYVKLNINGQLSQNDFKPNVKERDPCIKITFQRTIAVPIRPEDIAKIYRGDLEALNQSEALTNLLQLIIRQGTNNRFVTRGKAYYDMAQANMRSLEGGRLELRRGIWHSARPADNRLILMIDTVSTAFYPGGQLASVMGNFLKERDIWRISRSSRNWPKMVKYFTKLRVKVLVPAKARDTTKTIKGFEPEGGLYRFDYHGDIITVQEYYWTVYQVRVQHPKAPGVVLKIQGDFKSVVPLEFCELLPGQIFKQKIPEDMTRQMVQFSSVRPNERFGQIMAAAGVYRHQENMAAVNMAVSETPLVVPGNFYPAPTLLYKDRTEPGPRDGKWNVVDRKFIVSTGLVFWGIVNCMPAEVDSRQLEELVNMLRHCCESHGMRVAPPATVQNCPQGSGVTQALDSVLDQILKGDPANPMRAKSVILVILPNSAADLRSAVKFWGDIKTGVQTQCLRSQGRGGIKRSDQYVNNLLLKINARFGGINFVVGSSPTFLHLHGPLPGPQSQDPKITGGNTIIFGADVSHPGPGVFSKPSVTSIVFSTNKHGAMYAAITEIQDPRVERITKLGQMVFRALKRFALCIQGPPINIIFYRDGLSEGEYDTTAKAEMGDIEEAINQFMASEKGYQSANAPPRPKVTYIVVGKRHHALLFPNPGVRDGLDDGKGNCKGGVAVHEGITQPYRYIADFYLQSHAAIQGTSRSSHYVVLKDDIFTRWGNQRVEALEEYSYALCHMYAKATRAVSIPAPVYYADLVCQRGAFHVNPDGGSFNFEEDSAASVAGSAREQRKAFKLPEWEAVFRPVHNEIKNRMYYL